MISFVKIIDPVKRTCSYMRSLKGVVFYIALLRYVNVTFLGGQMRQNLTFKTESAFV